MNKIYYEHFYKNIAPSIKHIENRRIKTLIKSTISAFFSLILGVLSGYLFIKFNNQNAIILTFALLGMNFFILKAIATIIYENRKFKSELYQEIFPLFFKPFANFVPWPKNQNTETIINSELFTNFDRQEDETCIFGNYKNTNILISQTKLTLPINGLENQNLFKGTLIQIELDKSTENTIIIVPKSNKPFIKSQKLNIKNEYFDIFTTNKNNLELVNENLLKILENISIAFDSKKLKFSLKNNIILIALEKKTPYRIGNLFQNIYAPKNYDKLINQFVAIFNLVDLLR